MWWSSNFRIPSFPYIMFRTKKPSSAYEDIKIGPSVSPMSRRGSELSLTISMSRCRVPPLAGVSRGRPVERLGKELKNGTCNLVFWVQPSVLRAKARTRPGWGKNGGQLLEEPPGHFHGLWRVDQWRLALHPTPIAIGIINQLSYLGGSTVNWCVIDIWKSQIMCRSCS